VVDDEGCRLTFAKTSALAVEHGLTVSDATYLELAIRRKLPLASRDELLCGAAKDGRVRLLL
jgi:predicted nucleic acid-binding protein